MLDLFSAFDLLLYKSCLFLLLLFISYCSSAIFPSCVKLDYYYLNELTMDYSTDSLSENDSRLTACIVR